MKPTSAPPPGGFPLTRWRTAPPASTGTCGISQTPYEPNTPGYYTYNSQILPLVQQGYAVVATDYQGMGAPGDPSYLVVRSKAATHSTRCEPFTIGSQTSTRTRRSSGATRRVATRPRSQLSQRVRTRRSCSSKELLCLPRALAFPTARCPGTARIDSTEWPDRICHGDCRCLVRHLSEPNGAQRHPYPSRCRQVARCQSGLRQRSFRPVLASGPMSDFVKDPVPAVFTRSRPRTRPVPSGYRCRSSWRRG